MLVNLFRFIFGYVNFSFSGGFNEGFVNSCYNENLNLKKIKIKNNILTAQTDIKTYKKLHKIAFRHGGRVKITKKKGVPFITAPLKNRWGVFAGALFFVFFISYMGGFIWNITVTGTDRITDAQIMDYLAHNGVKIGNRWANIDKENLEFAVLADFDDVAWISINKFGSTAGIEINETVAAPNLIDTKKITNVVAKRDGVITHITALGGLPAVQAGEAVTKGDLLISGVYESEVDGKNHFTRAHGAALAQIEEDITLNISREQNNKVYTKEKEYKSIYFFGVEIPLYLKKDKEKSDTVIEKSYLLLNSYRLPIATVKRTEKYYEIDSKTLTDEELESLAKSELNKRKQKELENANILTEKVTLSTSDDGCLITGEYVFIEDIGKESEIKIEDYNNDNNK